MTHALLTRLARASGARRADRPEVALAPGAGAGLARGRLHECAGPSRHAFALCLAARLDGPVIWIAPGWDSAALNPDGMRDFAAPARFLFLAPRRAEDLLWTMEEALRSGAVPLVVAEVPEAPGLTPVRRLHLAAEAGGAEAAGLGGGKAAAPLGLLLTPGAGGAAGVETRWHMAPAPPDSAPDLRCAPAPAAGPAPLGPWHLSRRRARSAPPCDWRLIAHPGEAGAPPRLELQPHAPAPETAAANPAIETNPA